MISDDLAIVLYTSTKGHFGYKDCYKHTVERMESEIPFFDEYTKVANIKRSPSDGEEQFIEMEAYLNEKGFSVTTVKGEWSHNKSSHSNGYYRDMLNALSQTCLHKHRYVLLMEDDWLLNFGGLFSRAATKAISFLDKDFKSLCVRINHNVHKDLSKAEESPYNWIYRQNLDYTKYGPTFTFQPTIVRLKEWYHSVRLINKAIDMKPDLLDSYHCELISGDTLKQFSDSAVPFYFFDPNIINATHIGEEEWIENHGL